MRRPVLLVTEMPIVDNASHLPLGPVGHAMTKPLEWWINDGLMAVFFLLVALEIKREALSGQLSSKEQLILPMVCAIAGVAVPALFFVALNRGDADAMRGWAIPTATDIAFALGVLALLGSRVPLGMKLLLSTIDVADDLIAILIIAVFYTQDLQWPALIGAAVVIAAMWVLGRMKVKRLAPYLLLGAVLWVLVLKSGVHATLAGVITAFFIPLRDHDGHSPLHRLEHGISPWSSFLIIPLFGFANAGVAFTHLSWSDVFAPLPLAIALGLLLGKQLGVFAGVLLAV